MDYQSEVQEANFQKNMFRISQICLQLDFSDLKPCIFHAKCSTGIPEGTGSKREPPLLQGTPLPRIHIQVLTAAFLFILSLTNKWGNAQTAVSSLLGTKHSSHYYKLVKGRKEGNKEKREGRKEGRQRERKEEERKEERKGEKREGGRTEEEARCPLHDTYLQVCSSPCLYSWTEIFRLPHTRTCSLITAAHSKSRHFNTAGGIWSFIQ